MVDDNEVYEVSRAPVPDRASDLLDFWFGGVKNGVIKLDKSRIDMWEAPNETQKDILNQRFVHDISLAARGEYGHWGLNPRGRLGIILLLDRFSEILLDPLEALENNNQAVDIALTGIRKNQDIELSIIERAFFYRPLMDQERLEMQNRSVELYQRLYTSAPADLKKYFENWLKTAEEKREIIYRFGRFPERNELLERESTEQEKAYLSEKNSP